MTDRPEPEREREREREQHPADTRNTMRWTLEWALLLVTPLLLVAYLVEWLFTGGVSLAPLAWAGGILGTICLMAVIEAMRSRASNGNLKS